MRNQLIPEGCLRGVMECVMMLQMMMQMLQMMIQIPSRRHHMHLELIEDETKELGYPFVRLQVAS